MVWTIDDDSRLLCAIYDYGMGSWEAIKMDPNTGLSDKILPDGQDAKPQTKQLQARSDYLLKILGKAYQQQQLLTQGKPVKPKRKPRAKAISKALVGDTEDISSAEDFTTSPVPGNSRRPSKGALKGGVKVKTEDEDSHVDGRTDEERLNDAKDRKAARKEKKANRKKDVGPMHFTANSVPRAVEIIGDLDPATFNEVRLVF